MALLLALALIAAAPPAAEPPLQVLASPAFDSLLQQTRRQCPAAAVRYIRPAELLDVEETFVARLGRREALRFRRAEPRTSDGEYRACKDSPGGASCPATAGLRALETSGLLPRFARAVCAASSSR